MTKTKSIEPRTESFPVRWLSEWFDMPDLFHRLDTMRPAFFSDRIKVEEEMRDDELIIRAELPGVDPDKDVEILLGDGVLRVTAERRHEAEETKEGMFRSEFSYGAFTRTVPLPKGAKVEDVKATYTDGILEVRVPVGKSAEAAQKVAITRSS